MVKNTKGGKHKAGARKHMTAVRNKRTRLANSDEEGEIYAYVSSISGGSHCRVICQDGHERICVIRGKFRGGRGKRNNFVARGTWLLVGIREWSSGTDRNDGTVVQILTQNPVLYFRTIPKKTNTIKLWLLLQKIQKRLILLQLLIHRTESTNMSTLMIFNQHYQHHYPYIGLMYHCCR